MIVGIDAGNHEVKVVSETKFKFLSDIGEWRERHLKNDHGDDMEFEYKGRKGFAGTLARYESEFNGSMMGDTKAHSDTLIRVLLALFKLGGQRYSIVVGQPISKHIEAEKERIKTMLRGTHEIKVNGISRTFTIERVEVAAEGATAFWSAPKRGLMRIIDVGSATVNCATLMNGRYVDRDSFTLPFGLNTTKTNDHRSLCRAIGAETLKKFKREDDVMIIGGAGAVLQPLIREIYPNAYAPLEPIYANAQGFYEVGKKLDKTQTSSL